MGAVVQRRSALLLAVVTEAQTTEHALLNCPAYADLRAAPRFAPLFANLPAHARLNAFVRSADQHTLGACVHACFERHSAAT
jgi:hypothetical protein